MIDIPHRKQEIKNPSYIVCVALGLGRKREAKDGRFSLTFRLMTDERQTSSYFQRAYR